MALQISYISPDYGITALESYAKIDSFRGNINFINFLVNYYVNQEARLEGKSPIGFFYFTMPYQDGMTYTAVYNYLKTLPEFVGSVDLI
jgi:hypothetical protein